MRRSSLKIAVIAAIFLFLGVAGGAIGMAMIPSSGSAPSIYDDFEWSSAANGFWHVNALGATQRIADGVAKLSGNSIELDRRVQTDPHSTVIAVRIRGIKFHKFQIGMGVYHAGTMGLEFDNDGIKCGRGTDQGWKVDGMTVWSNPPVGKWYYLQLKVINPYPDPDAIDRLYEKYGDNAKDKIKPVTLECSAWDARGKLLRSVRPHDPPPNANYAGLDEAYMRTWDSNNEYDVDWLYAGPPSGNPLNTVVRGKRP